MPEILNIEYHTQLLLIRALNKHDTKVKAFAALGVSERTGHNLVKYHEVQYDKVRGYYTDKIVEFKNINNGKVNTTASNNQKG